MFFLLQGITFLCIDCIACITFFLYLLSHHTDMDSYLFFEQPIEGDAGWLCLCVAQVKSIFGLHWHKTKEDRQATCVYLE